MLMIFVSSYKFFHQYDDKNVRNTIFCIKETQRVFVYVIEKHVRSQVHFFGTFNFFISTKDMLVYLFTYDDDNFMVKRHL
jgi:hypothetical protein